MSKERTDLTNEAFTKVGRGLSDLSSEMEGFRKWPVHIVGFSVRGPSSQGQEFLVTVRAVDAEGERWVGFHGALSLGEAICGASVRVQNDTMKWKPDEWAKK